MQTETRPLPLSRGDRVEWVDAQPVHFSSVRCFGRDGGLASAELYGVLGSHLLGVPGLALYGVDPTLERGVALDPVMTLVTRVSRAVDLPAGSRIGYGGAYVTRQRTRILTLPIGYADGLPRAAGGTLTVGLGGVRVPLVGRVSMDLAAVDAGPEADARVGDEVLIFGRRAGLTIGVEEQATALASIPYELLVGIGPRVPRVAVEGQCSGSSGSEGGPSRS